MAKQLTLLVGPPGAGKSTIANQMKKDGIIRISPDDQGKYGHKEIFNRAMLNKNDIVIDGVNFNKEQREQYLKPAKRVGYNTKIIVLHVPSKTCFDRCKQHTAHPKLVTKEDIESAIHLFFSQYERVSNNEADEVIRDGWVTKKASKAIWCDLDGTLANIEHRISHVKVNWEKFFSEMTNDSVNHWCSELLVLMGDRYPVAYVTGRPEEYREHTELWLDNNRLRLPGSKLFMRQANDYRKDNIIKEIILEFEIKTRYNMLFAIEDRKQVVDMLRDHNITVLQCASGDF